MKLQTVVILCLLCPSLLLAQDDPSLLEKRGDHQTELVEKTRDKEPPPSPQGETFILINYPSKVGKLSAYVTKSTQDAAPGPAIIWLTGGFPSSSPGEGLWSKTSVSNEQSARIYRLKGVQMMFPILRGRSGNPGTIERFYGEVDDVISAYEFLASQAHIDPKRIYLGGHSTGGTLALLVAESTDRFAGIISLGPVEDDYGEENALYVWNEKERSLREPIRHLGSIKSPTFVVEGEFGNSDSLEALRKANKNPNVKITTIDGANHFDVIHPLNLLVASAIMESKDGKLDLSLDQLKTSYQVFSRQERESFDLQMLSELRGDGLDIDEVQAVNFYVVSDKTLAESFKNAAGKSGFSLAGSKKSETSEGQSYFVNRWEKQIQLSDLKALFEATATISGLAKEARLSYEGWSVEVK